MTPAVVIAVLIAGAIGALARYGISLAFAKRQGLPIAVLLVNVIGSAIGGTVLALFDFSRISADWRLVVLTGLAGGLTTFSTWSVGTIQLAQTRRSRLAWLNVIVNLLLGIAAAAFAYLLAISILSR